MQAEEIGLLLKQEQGQFLAFLSAFEYRRGAGQKKRDEELARDIARLLSGMANADGGTLLVGVDSDKSVTGIPVRSRRAAHADSSAAESIAAAIDTIVRKSPPR